MIISFDRGRYYGLKPEAADKLVQISITHDAEQQALFHAGVTVRVRSRAVRTPSSKCIRGTCTTRVPCRSCGRRSAALLPLLGCLDAGAGTPAAPGSLLSSPRWWSLAATFYFPTRWGNRTWRCRLTPSPRSWFLPTPLLCCPSRSRCSASPWTRREMTLGCRCPRRCGVCSASRAQGSVPLSSTQHNNKSCKPRGTAWCRTEIACFSRGMMAQHVDFVISGYIP